MLSDLLQRAIKVNGPGQGMPSIPIKLSHFWPACRTVLGGQTCDGFLPCLQSWHSCRRSTSSSIGQCRPCHPWKQAEPPNGRPKASGFAFAAPVVPGLKRRQRRQAKRYPARAAVKPSSVRGLSCRSSPFPLRKLIEGRLSSCPWPVPSSPSRNSILICS